MLVRIKNGARDIHSLLMPKFLYSENMKIISETKNYATVKWGNIYIYTFSKEDIIII